VSVAPNFRSHRRDGGRLQGNVETERLKIDEDAFKKDTDFIKAMIRMHRRSAVRIRRSAASLDSAVDPQAQPA